MADLRGDYRAASQDRNAIDQTHIDTSSNTSATDNEPEPVCTWRTTDHHDQECSRFVDCPSHLVPRLPSIDASERVVPGLTSTLPVRSRPDGEIGGRNAVGIGAIEAATSEPAAYSTNDRGNSEWPFAPRTSSMEDRDTRSNQVSPDRSSSRDTSSSRHNRTRRIEETMPSNSSSYLGESSGRAQAESPTLQIAQPPASIFPALHPDQRQSLNRRRSSLQQVYPSSSASEPVGRSDTDSTLPRWQPDAEVTYCPICQTQFSIFVRKHHCRKCGRVVCNSCSPHRIIIPYQYIVRPPGSELLNAPSYSLNRAGTGYVDANRISGGERVRLCNPCVPDPNTAPPQSPIPPSSPRSTHQRSRSSVASLYGGFTSDILGQLPATGNKRESSAQRSSRTRSITMGPSPQVRPGFMVAPGRSSMSYQTSLERFLAIGSSSTSSHGHRSRRGMTGDTEPSLHHRALPPTPQIAEEDECPICHQELPGRRLPNFELLRESHISSCIQSHSTYGSPCHGTVGVAGRAAPRRTGMYTYAATEKDCVDDAECTICLEEFEVDVPMARLECLCRFHRSCIMLWFVNHPGRCPVHQHDGFGY